MGIPIATNSDFINPWILEQDNPWNVVIGVVAIVLFWRAISRAMDTPNPFDE